MDEPLNLALRPEPTDVDSLVHGTEGVTAFHLKAGEGQVVRI